MVGDLNMGGFKVTNLAAPVAGTDAANRNFVEDSLASEFPIFYRRWSKTAAGGETSLSGNDDNGIALSYVAGSEKVFINGALQVRGVDYSGTTGSTLTGIPALIAGDIVEVHSSSNYTVGTVPDGSITNAKVDGGAAIQSTKLAFTPSGAGAVTRSVASKLADVVSVKDFGAVGDGARINQALAANGGMVYVPQQNYTLEADVTPTTGGLFIDPGATFDDQSKLKPRGQFSDTGNGVNAWRLQDRVFVGGAVNVSPTTTPVLDGYDIAGDPTGINSDYLERSAAVASSNAYGGTGGLFAAKQSRQYTSQGYTVWSSSEAVAAGAKRGYYEKLYTATTSGTTGSTPPSHTSGAVSDGGVTWQFDRYTYMVPIGLSAVADVDVADGHSCWAMYIEGLRRPAGGTLLTTEVAVKNKGSQVLNNPYNILPGGSTIGFWFAAGGDATLGAPANPSTAAIAIGKNATTWDRGIVFASDSLTGGEAIQMASGHSISWYSPDTSLKVQVKSTRTNSAPGKSFLEFNDGGIWFGASDALSAVIGGSSSDNSWLTLAGGTNSSYISVNSAAANAELVLAAKGTGTIKLNSPLEFAYSGFTPATTPSNFTADRYMVVYNGGIPFYIPARLTTW